MSQQPPRPPRNPPTPPGDTPSSRAKMKDAVQELVAQVKEQKEQNRADVVAEKEKSKRKRRMRLVQVAALAVLMIASVIYAVPRWNQPFTAPAGEPARDDARKTLVFAARLLDQYQLRGGRLPGTFSQVGVNLPTLVYTRTGDTYSVSITVDGEAITYHKGDDPVRFLSSH
jgi:hypothetical protein